MLTKTIVQGRLNFGSKKSYDKCMKMFLHRFENFYKADLVFDEEYFEEDAFGINIPRLVKPVGVKTWKNSVSLLEYLAQFAVSGKMELFMTESGKILKYSLIEPTNDKVVVQNFLKAKEIALQKGKEKEAQQLLDEVIVKFDKHAHAYEKRGYLHYVLENYDDAIEDFSSSITIDENIAEAYYYRAKIYVIQKNYQKAADDLEMTIKKSLAVQDIYWQARFLKSKCHIKLKQYEKAAVDLKLFSNRNFPADSENIGKVRESHYRYGKLLLEMEQNEEALEALNVAVDMEEGEDSIPLGERIYYRGIAKQKSGKKGYIGDFKTAAELGFVAAEEMTQEIK